MSENGEVLVDNILNIVKFTIMTFENSEPVNVY